LNSHRLKLVTDGVRKGRAPSKAACTLHKSHFSGEYVRAVTPGQCTTSKDVTVLPALFFATKQSSFNCCELILRNLAA